MSMFFAIFRHNRHFEEMSIFVSQELFCSYEPRGELLNRQLYLLARLVETNEKCTCFMD